jgi:broad specificity phosphatase PhoE
MATRVLLIRHASVDAIGVWLAGRLEGVHLNQRGQMEAQQLVDRLSGISLDAIYSSPLERAQQTARPVAIARDLLVTAQKELTDVHFGHWTGKSFKELNELPEWHHFNRHRSTGRIPGGESPQALVQRMVAAIEAIRAQHEGETVAIFSHCDPIRFAIAHYLAIDLDSLLEVAIDPASISVLDIGRFDARIVTLNDRSERLAIRASLSIDRKTALRAMGAQ